jgi:hypothetical protein
VDVEEPKKLLKKSLSTQKKIKYGLSQHDEINNKINRCVNSSEDFPDFSDIHGWISDASTVHNLQLT